MGVLLRPESSLREVEISGLEAAAFAASRRSVEVDDDGWLIPNSARSLSM